MKRLRMVKDGFQGGGEDADEDGGGEGGDDCGVEGDGKDVWRLVMLQVMHGTRDIHEY